MARQWALRGALRAGLLAALAIVVQPDAAPADLPQVRALGIEVASRLRASELDLALSGPADFRVFTLDNPRRAVVDIRGLDWAGLAPLAPGGGPVAAVRWGLFQPGWARIVLDLDAPMAVARAGFHDGPDGTRRFRLRLVPTDAATFAARAGTPAAAAWSPPPDPASPVRRAPGAPFVVVIDPGHGGIDPGALRDGLVEKEIALQAARAIAAALEATGRFRTVLTREADIFLPLSERVRIARAQGADAFVSIHANTEPTGTASGVSVFTLSEAASDKDAERLAALENRADVLAGLDLDGETSTVARILVDLARSGTNVRSRRLAETMVRVFDGQSRMIRTNPHRYAGFHVLKAPDVPSVLIELGFLTNPADRARLASAAWIDTLAGELAGALALWSEDDAKAARLAGR